MLLRNWQSPFGLAIFLSLEGSPPGTIRFLKVSLPLSLLVPGDPVNTGSFSQRGGHSSAHPHRPATFGKCMLTCQGWSPGRFLWLPVKHQTVKRQLFIGFSPPHILLTSWPPTPNTQPHPAATLPCLDLANTGAWDWSHPFCSDVFPPPHPPMPTLRKSLFLLHSLSLCV